MKTGRLFLLPTLAGVALLGLSPILPAHAQDEQQGGEVHGHVVIRTPDGVKEFDLDPSQLPPPGAGGNVIIMKMGPDGQVMTFGGDPGSLSFLGPKGMMLGGPGGGMMGNLNIVDPGTSYIHPLIKRDDVRSELFISSKQREQLDAMDANQKQFSQEQQKQMTEAMKGFAGGDLQGKSPEDLKAALAEQTQKIHAMMQNMQDNRDKQLAAILTPKQMTRLKQLDFQWRGPLAMGVKPVADQAKLTTEQAPKVADLLRAYREEVHHQLGFGVRTAVLGSKTGAGAGATQTAPAAPPTPSTPEAMQAKLATAKKEIDKARISLGDRAIKELSDVQRREWNAMTGPTFHFRFNF